MRLVACPISGCDYQGEPSSVEAHVSAKTTDGHQGKVGNSYHDELTQVDGGDDSAEVAADDADDTDLADDVLADLDAVADELDEVGDEVAGDDSDEVAADDLADDPDADDVELVEDTDADDPDDSTSLAEEVKADAKPDAATVGTAASASLLGAPFLLEDIPTKWIAYGAVGLLGIAVVLYLLNQQDDDNQQQEQHQQQPPEPANVSGGLVST